MLVPAVEEVLLEPRNISGGFRRAGFFPYKGVAAIDRDKLEPAKMFLRASEEQEVEVVLGEGRRAEEVMSSEPVEEWRSEEEEGGGHLDSSPLSRSSYSPLLSLESGGAPVPVLVEEGHFELGPKEEATGRFSLAVCLISAEGLAFVVSPSTGLPPKDNFHFNYSMLGVEMSTKPFPDLKDTSSLPERVTAKLLTSPPALSSYLASSALTLGLHHGNQVLASASLPLSSLLPLLKDGETTSQTLLGLLSNQPQCRGQRQATIKLNLSLKQELHLKPILQPRSSSSHQSATEEVETDEPSPQLSREEVETEEPSPEQGTVEEETEEPREEVETEEPRKEVETEEPREEPSPEPATEEPETEESSPEPSQCLGGLLERYVAPALEAGWRGSSRMVLHDEEEQWDVLLGGGVHEEPRRLGTVVKPLKLLCDMECGQIEEEATGEGFHYDVDSLATPVKLRSGDHVEFQVFNQFEQFADNLQVGCLVALL